MVYLILHPSKPGGAWKCSGVTGEHLPGNRCIFLALEPNLGSQKGGGASCIQDK